MLSEIEVYGEGFAPETSYRTAVIDLGAPVNFGRIFWEFEKFRKTLGEAEPIPAPDAPISLVLETRTGRDDTPKAHYIISDIGTERQVDEAAYNKALEKSPFVQGNRPGDKSSIKPRRAKTGVSGQRPMTVPASCFVRRMRGAICSFSSIW